MNKAITYFVAISIAALACVPSIYFSIKPQMEYWPWMVILSGFAALYTIFLRTNHIVRIVAIGGFISCFYSSVPFISFTSYMSIIGCCYFYIICSKVIDWKPIFQVIQALIFVNIILGFMQWTGYDSITNFGRDIEHYGAIGQHMQMGSMSVILTAPALLINPYNLVFTFATSIFCKSTWTSLCAGIGLFIYLFNKQRKIAVISLVFSMIFFVGLSISKGKFKENLSSRGRFGISKMIIKRINEKPLTGWGAGTFKYVFSALDTEEAHTKEWRTAHNCFLQAGFEFGYPGLFLSIFVPLFIAYRLWMLKLTTPLAGVAMISFDAMVHFPSRMIQSVLIIIAFLAYCEIQIKRGMYNAIQ